MKVYQAISSVMAALAVEGITKNNKNQQQGYSFRGIDNVYNALAPILSKNGLVILPRVLNREVTERTTAKGGFLFYVVVQVEFDLVCAEDGSKHTIATIGEAMDSADKATNKAMSAAYKYACIQAFCIPTESDNDADATTHEPLPEPQGVELVNATDISSIRAKLIAGNKTEEAFCNYYKIVRIEDLPKATATTYLSARKPK